ncbi:MAG TPA: lysylphosphatidylglycerol synthase domain-containing protein [Gemmatimonadales bacterium]|nr:lysylphosphatidylglycerol synthase domain-containing protein [Gemmatimonadales bacterium]
MRRGLAWAAQGVAAVVVAVLVWRAIARNWSDFRALHVSLALKPGWIAVSALAVFLTYMMQIESWRRILAGWAQRLPYGRAARIWLVVNLGRYIPGKVWSVAGLIVLAQRAGVQTWAAGASAFAIQAIGVGTAVAVVAAATPGAASPWRLGGAAFAAALTIGGFAWNRGARWLARAAGLADQFRPLPLAAVAESAALTLASWVGYGVAFWLLALGLGLPGTLSVTTATGVFALGYIVGLLALFAPGGVGVREVVFIGLLAPALGSGGAVALSVGSRAVLTLCEAIAPLVVVLITGSPKEDVGVRT